MRSPRPGTRRSPPRLSRIEAIYAIEAEIHGQDAILIRPMAYVTLTIDHRVVDGHQTNAWLTRFVEVLEDRLGFSKQAANEVRELVLATR